VVVSEAKIRRDFVPADYFCIAVSIISATPAGETMSLLSLHSRCGGYPGLMIL
jgi:hypothetical protein